MPRPQLVIVGGAPASGKTTLARRLASDLRLAVLTKDDIKESLADALGAGDRQRSRELGSAAYSVLYELARRILDANVGVIVEANFYRDRSESSLRELASRADPAIVLCQSEAAIRRGRFKHRGEHGERHQVHLDAEILAREWSDDDSSFAIEIGCRRLIVDTSDGYTPDFDSIERFLRSGAATA